MLNGWVDTRWEFAYSAPSAHSCAITQSFTTFELCSAHFFRSGRLMPHGEFKTLLRELKCSLTIALAIAYANIHGDTVCPVHTYSQTGAKILTRMKRLHKKIRSLKNHRNQLAKSEIAAILKERFAFTTKPNQMSEFSATVTDITPQKENSVDRAHSHGHGHAHAHAHAQGQW